MDFDPLSFAFGFATAFGLIFAWALGEASNTPDAKPEPKPEPTVTRVTLHGTDFDEEAFYGWAERGGRN